MSSKVIEKYIGTIQSVEEAERGPHLVVVQDDPNSSYDGKRFRVWGTEYGESTENPNWSAAKQLVGQAVEVSYYTEERTSPKGKYTQNLITQILPVEGGGSAPGSDWGVPTNTANVPAKALESNGEPRTDVRPTTGPLEAFLAVIEASAQDTINVVNQIRKVGAPPTIDYDAYLKAAEGDGFTDKAITNKLTALFPYRTDWRQATVKELQEVAAALGFTWEGSF